MRLRWWALSKQLWSWDITGCQAKTEGLKEQVAGDRSGHPAVAHAACTNVDASCGVWSAELCLIFFAAATVERTKCYKCEKVQCNIDFLMGAAGLLFVLAHCAGHHATSRLLPPYPHTHPFLPAQLRPFETNSSCVVRSFMFPCDATTT